MPLFASVVSRSEETVDVALTADVRAVDAVDPHDALNPDCWSVTGPGSPAVVRVEVERRPGQPDRARLVRLVVLPRLRPGASYAVSPSASLHLADHTPVTVETARVVGAERAPVAGPTAGNPATDIALPMVAATDGGLSLLDRQAALEARLDTLAQTKLAAFGHLPGFGTRVEPKRQFSAADMAREARQMGAVVRADPDVLRGNVTVRAAPDAAGVLEVVFDVEPRFASAPFSFTARVQAYGAPA